MSKIKIAVVGIGNCASSLIQGIEFYHSKEEEEEMGMMKYTIWVVTDPRILKW
jgi:myo-inositol-1-phosphate synthase